MQEDPYITDELPIILIIKYDSHFMCVCLVYEALLFTYRTIIQGYRRPITYDNLFDLLDRDKCKTIEPCFHQEWERRLIKWNEKHPPVE